MAAFASSLVESPHTLRIPPSNNKKALCAFSKEHGLRNEYLKDALAGKPRILVGAHTQHVWQSVRHVRWMQHENTGELVVIVGGASQFLRTSRAKQNDMSFILRTLQDRLQASAAAGSNISSADGEHRWRIHPIGFEPLQIAALADGASLAGIFVNASSSSTLPDFVAMTVRVL